MSNWQERPKKLPSTTVKQITGHGNLFIIISYQEPRVPFEVFVSGLGKSGECAYSQMEAIGKTISIGLRSGVDPKRLIDSLINMQCPHPIMDPERQVFIQSPYDAIARVLRDFIDGKIDSSQEQFSEEEDNEGSVA